MLNNSLYIADTAKLIGNIEAGSGVNIWYNAVIRVDSGRLIIGENTSIQDGVVLHSNEKHPIKIGKNCSIGHNSTINGVTIGDNTIIGINSTILDNTIIGENCIIGAHTLLLKNSIIPNDTVVFGVPGKLIRKVTLQELKEHLENINYYLRIAKKLLIQ